ncbi:MAG: YggS family pyridoxal phosphate-dependent enzyme [Anaerolinea sp.]|nr:YggS family pyridoxal phosphate-dependent enzyme [Anaerolinea sp.]
MKFHSQIANNYLRLHEEVNEKLVLCGRNPGEVRVILVAKHQAIENINAAIEAGAQDFAENYPEQLLPKLPLLQNIAIIRWHLIGHVQSRKAGLVMENFDYLHSLDSLRLARLLEAHQMGGKPQLPVLLEINLGGEATKSGYKVGTTREYDMFVKDIQGMQQLSHLSIKGLMTMPPYTSDGKTSRVYFIQLRRLLDKINHSIPGLKLTELSMGTSQDYLVAIEEGATFIRIGTRVFGERK